MFAAQYWKAGAPREFITSGGFGTMGFCLPSAIGAQLGRPDALVVGIDGDGSFQMTVQDLATAADLHLPLKIFVLDNRALGMVRQLQQLFHGRRYPATPLSGKPDLVRLAEAYGCLGVRAETPDELDAAIERALAHRAGPAIVDVSVSETENVFPIVPAGAALSEMIEHESILLGSSRDMAPTSPALSNACGASLTHARSIIDR
jgi:acetolactate synthase-1/2/3 large subunit